MWVGVKRNVVMCMRYICSCGVIYMNFPVYFQYVVTVAS